MQPVINRQFREAVVELDGHHFINCQFIECQLVFSASETVAFDGCVFDRCGWVFDGAAERTLQFLAALYGGLRPEGEALVETVFGMIREDRVGATIDLRDALVLP